MSGSPRVRVPRSCDEFCDSIQFETGRRCEGGHYVEVAFQGASDTASVWFDDDEHLTFSLAKWVAMMQAAALVAPTRGELSEVTPGALMAVLLDPDSVSAEYRSRYTGELLPRDKDRDE